MRLNIIFNIIFIFKKLIKLFNCAARIYKCRQTIRGFLIYRTVLKCRTDFRRQNQGIQEFVDIFPGILSDREHLV